MRKIVMTMVLALTGCGGGGQLYWENPPGMSEEQARVKFYECKRDGRAILAQGSSNLFVAVRATRECLAANGFIETYR